MRKIVSVLLLLGLMLSISACAGKSEAVKAYEEAVKALNEKNAALDSEMDALSAILAEDGEPLVEEDFTNAEKALDKAKESKFEAPKKENDDEKIAKQTEEINAVSYDEIISEMKTSGKTLQDSRKKYILLTAPTEDFIIQRLKTVKTVDFFEAVTEDNDPNGHLNKQGGYTAAIFFYSSLVPKSSLEYAKNKVMKNGTNGGGSIEVYSTVDDAKRRDEELGTYDGTILSSGSHYVYGTVVIRTSSSLKASQQKTLTKNVLDALTKLDE